MATGGGLTEAELKKYSDKPLLQGDTWCLLDKTWYKDVVKFLDTADDDPGPIDNTPLFKEDKSDIRDHLVHEMDYKLVPEEAWTLLVQQFGLADGEQSVKRKVIVQGMFIKQFKVEVYLTEFNLADQSNMEETVRMKFSKADTLDKVMTAMKEQFDIPEDKETRLWNIYTSNTYEMLSRLDNTIQDAGLFSGQLIIIEQMNNDGSWPRQRNFLRSGKQDPPTQKILPKLVVPEENDVEILSYTDAGVNKLIKLQEELANLSSVESCKRLKLQKIKENNKQQKQDLENQHNIQKADLERTQLQKMKELQMLQKKEFEQLLEKQIMEQETYARVAKQKEDKVEEERFKADKEKKVLETKVRWINKQLERLLDPEAKAQPAPECLVWYLFCNIHNIYFYAGLLGGDESTKENLPV